LINSTINAWLARVIIRQSYALVKKSAIMPCYYTTITVMLCVNMLNVIMLSVIMLRVDMLNAIMLSVVLSVAFSYCYAYSVLSVAFYYCYAECHYAECRYDECHYAEYHYDECRGAQFLTYIGSNKIN
jgi:hypothetical protein